MISKKAQPAANRQVASRERKSSRGTSWISFYAYLQALIAKHPEWAEQQEEGKLDAVAAYALHLMRGIDNGIEPPESLHELFGLEYEEWRDTVLWPAEKLYFQYVDAQLEANPSIFEGVRRSLLKSACDMKHQRRSRPAR
jgi:hypothetical protein